MLIAAFYGVYSFTRNLFGSALVENGEEPVHAFDNAIRIIDIEKALHIFHEKTDPGVVPGLGRLHAVLEHLSTARSTSS